MKKTKINPFSEKRQAHYLKYMELCGRLCCLCDNKSELSGNKPDWQSQWLVDPHHIDGREGKRLLDPFNIILLVRDEHQAIEEEKPINGHKYTKEELLNLIRPIRIRQGFKEV